MFHNVVKASFNLQCAQETLGKLTVPLERKLYYTQGEEVWGTNCS